MFSSGTQLVFLPALLRPVADVLVGGLLDALVLCLAFPVVDGVALGVGHLLALLNVLSVALLLQRDQDSPNDIWLYIAQACKVMGQFQPHFKSRVKFWNIFGK